MPRAGRSMSARADFAVRDRAPLRYSLPCEINGSGSAVFRVRGLQLLSADTYSRPVPPLSAPTLPHSAAVAFQLRLAGLLRVRGGHAGIVLLLLGHTVAHRLLA